MGQDLVTALLGDEKEEEASIYLYKYVHSYVDRDPPPPRLTRERNND